MCMPPSNKMHTRATVTTRSTVAAGSTVPSEESEACGHSCAAITAAIRKNAGAGTRSRALSRLDSTAAVPARPITADDESELAGPRHKGDPTGGQGEGNAENGEKLKNSEAGMSMFFIWRRRTAAG